MFKGVSVGVKKHCCAVELHITIASNLLACLGLIPCRMPLPGIFSWRHRRTSPWPRTAWTKEKLGCSCEVCSHHHSGGTFTSEWVVSASKGKSVMVLVSLVWYTDILIYCGDSIEFRTYEMLDVQHSLLRVLNEEFSYFPTNGNWSWLATWYRTVF